MQSLHDQQDLIQDLQPFFAFVKPEGQRKELEDILKGLNVDGLITGCLKLNQNQYKITLDHNPELTYNSVLGHLGHIEIHKETIITFSPLEHGQPKSESETVTDQRRISFNPPLTLKLSWIYTGTVESIASDYYISQRGKGEQSRFEVSGSDLQRLRLVPEKIIDHLKCLRWV